MCSIRFQRWSQPGHNLSYAGEIFIGKALSSPVAAFECIEESFPHQPCDARCGFPVCSTFEPNFELPNTGKLCRTDESALSGAGISVGPLYFQDRSPR